MELNIDEKVKVLNDVVVRKYGESIFANNRRRLTVHSRRVLCKILREHKYCYAEIGRAMSIDHATAIYHCKGWSKSIAKWPELLVMYTNTSSAFNEIVSGGGLSESPLSQLDNAITVLEQRALIADLTNKNANLRYRNTMLKKERYEVIEASMLTKRVGSPTTVLSERTVDTDDIMNLVRSRMRVGDEKNVSLLLTRYFNGYGVIA